MKQNKSNDCAAGDVAEWQPVAVWQPAAVLVAVLAVMAAEKAEARGKSPPRPWPGGVIPYAAHSDLPRDREQAMVAAMNTLQEVSCLRFVRVRWGHDSPHLRVTGRHPTCWTSRSGYTGGDIVMNLNSGCLARGRILHELLHVAGLLHEHTRPDRDRHVHVHWGNIMPGQRSQFVVRREHQTFGLPYDHASVMHYTPGMFAKARSEKVLESKSTEALGGSELSALDVQRLRLLYAHCGSSNLTGDEQGGYSEETSHATGE